MESAPASPPRLAWARSCGGLLTIGAFALAVLIVLVYQEENWRGARVWAATKAELEARGESFDQATFIPPPVPDKRNFAASYEFQQNSDHRLNVVESLKGITDNFPYTKEMGKDKGSLPYLGDWSKDEKVDPAAVEKQLENYLHEHRSGAQVLPHATPHDVFSQICPVLQSLRLANANLPLCRFDVDFPASAPWNFSFGPTTDLLRVVKALSYDARLALLGHESEVALDDSRVVWKIYSGLRQEPTLISALVGIGVVSIQLGVLQEGLAGHDWTDAQLAEIDDSLGRIDALTHLQFSLRSEVAIFTVPTIDASIARRSLWLNAMGGSGGTFDYKDLEAWEMLAIKTLYGIAPSGWLEINKADSVRRILDAAWAVDPVARRVYPEREEATLPVKEDGPLSFATVAVRPIVNAVRNFAFFQVRLDEARIACRLERYRLAHGAFPAALDALVPAYGAELPHDAMNGAPYIYRLNADGTYILYSVGWDQKDDHGDLGGHSYGSKDSPDWVWLSHPAGK